MQIGPPDLVRGDAGHQVRGQFGERLLQPGRPGVAEGSRVHHPGERSGGILEGFAFEETGEKQVSLFPEGQLLFRLTVPLIGQQAAGLEFEEDGRD